MAPDHASDTVPRRGARAPVAPSGEQFQLTLGEQRAVVVEVGGGIRTYSVGAREVLDPYPLDSMCDGAHGAALIPWPNRLADGRYSFAGSDHRLALTEPDRGNAIHGLLRWRPWRASERSPERVVMSTRLHPLPGYPFTLDVSVAYELHDGGLAVTTTATNVGADACPFGAGHHPYLSAGGALLDDCTVQLTAATRIVTDAERMLPIGREPVAGTPLDLGGAPKLGALKIDSAYTDLDRDPSGRASVTLGCPDGAAVELWADASYDYLEIYTGDTLAPARRRRGLGVEPMSCAPNALASGEGVVRLEPGESVAGRWGARLS